MLNFENWTELSDRVQYNLYKTECLQAIKFKEELAEAIEKINDLENELGVVN